MVDVMENLRDRTSICIWIGKNIHAVNAELKACLQACHECFHYQKRRPIQIFAVPIAQPYGIDGLCNPQTTPVTILVDVGRVVPQDWLKIVAHEYAHALVGNFGHHREFANILSHLCLGLGLEPPGTDLEGQLRHWPPCKATLDPLAFWRGQ